MLNNVKITTIINPLDLLSPHSCRGCGHIGDILCDRCKKYMLNSHHNFCPICKRKNINGKCSKCRNLPPIFVINYRHGIIDQLIHDLKYNSARSAAIPLAKILNQILPSIQNPVSVVPLPTISQHIRKRGLDHTKLIAKHLAKSRSNWQVNSLIIRNKNSVQVGADRKTRLFQAKTAYSLNPKIKISKNTTYLLFDDVWTTGASMKSAIKILRQAGVKKIIVAILAVSEF